MHEHRGTDEPSTPAATIDSTVELVVDDSERQLLTPVLRHFLARGYNPLDAEPGDQIRLESDDGYVIVRSELLDQHRSASGEAASGVVLSISASSIGSIDLRHAVGRAITEFGGLAARGDDPLDADHTFLDQRGVARAVLRTPH
ncbi:MAG: hypothetical protein R2710_22005 [Acidimicrobiales bacterium]